MTRCTEITSAFFDELLKSINRYYIIPLRERFTRVQQTAVNNEHVLSFRALKPDADTYVDVEVRAGTPIQLRMVPSNARLSEEDITELKEDLTIAVRWFEEYIRKTSLYFAWVAGEKVIPEKPPQKRNNIIYRLFSESMLLFFVLFTVVSIVFFIFFGLLAPIFLVAIQLFIVLFSDKIIIRTGEWRITERNPNVHIFQYYLPVEKHKDVQQKLSQETLITLKKEIYESSFAVGKPLTIETCHDAFLNMGSNVDRRTC